MRISAAPGALAALALLSLAACGGKGDAAPAPPAAAGAPAGATGRPGGGGPGGGPGGRGGALVLGAADVVTLAPTTLEASLPISGDLKPIEEIAVRSRVEGDVLQVLVREGDRVAEGQLLARFENAVQEGERASSTADRESARADVANAQWNADQSAELFKAGAIAERDLRNAQQALAAARARLAAAEARLRATTQLAQDTRIVAPTTGTVATRAVEPGEHVLRGATLFTVVRHDVLELEAAVPARLAGELAVDQLVRFTTGGRPREGRIARIAPTINPASRTLTVYAQVRNSDGELRGNAFATGRIVGRTIPGTLAVPTPAVRYSARGEQPFVYRIEDDKVQPVDVQLGVVDEVRNLTQVTAGLAEGDRIVVGNVGALGRGMTVRVVSPEQGREPRARGGDGAAGAGARAPAAGGAARDSSAARR